MRRVEVGEDEPRMLKLTQELVSAGRECRPEQYLFLFLKFISAICPTIEYDYTMSVDGL